VKVSGTPVLNQGHEKGLNGTNLSLARGIDHAVVKHRRFVAEAEAVDPVVLAVQIVQGAEESAENPSMAADIVFDGNWTELPAVFRLARVDNRHRNPRQHERNLLEDEIRWASLPS
jgi:hypothetical protein